MATNRSEERQLEIFRGLRQEHYEDLKESDPEEAERYAENTIQVYLEGSDWPLLKGRKSRESATVSLGMDGVRKEWNHYRELLEERELDAWPLLERQRDYFEAQIEQAEEEMEQMPVVFPKDPAATLEEKAAKEIRQVIHYARMIFQRKLYVLRKIMRQWALTRHVPALTDEEARSMGGASPGRKSTLTDPAAYPAETLNAVLEWTDDDENRARPFRSDKKRSLCGFVSDQLADPAGWQIPQDTIKSRLRSLMDELNVDLPHGPTNKLSYFEAREQITEAVKGRGLFV